jgi:hypothetical protein
MHCSSPSSSRWRPRGSEPRSGAGGARTHDRRIMRATGWVGRDSYSPAGLLGWLSLVRVRRWLFGTGCGLDADCLPDGTRSEGMPSQQPGLSTTDTGQGRTGRRLAVALEVGLDAWPAAVRTIGRWEGLPGGECRRYRCGRARRPEARSAALTASDDTATATTSHLPVTAPMIPATARNTNADQAAARRKRSVFADTS